MKIRLYLVPGDETHAPAARFLVEDIPPDRIEAYRSAIEGVRYDKNRRARVVALDKLSPILKRLREGAFDVTIDPAVVAGMGQFSIQSWFDYQAVRDRILRIDRDTFARTGAKGNGRKLYFYQVDGAIWLSSRKGGLLADEQGLGKTAQAIVALPAGVPCVVVCPAKVKGSWKREFGVMRPKVNVTVVEGRKGFRLPRDGECLVLNYEILPPVHDPPCKGKKPPKRCPGCLRSTTEMVIGPRGAAEFKILGHLSTCKGLLAPEPCMGCAAWLKKIPKGLVLIGDELHRVKDNSADQTKRFRAFAEAVRAADGRTWGITGTPIENHPRDLWSLYVALGVAEEAFGDWDTFTGLFKGQKTRFGWSWELPDADDTAEIASRIRRVSLRRMNRDVRKGMPTKTWQEIPVTIDRRTIQECEDALREDCGEEAYEKLLEAEDELLEKEMPKFKRISAMRAKLATAKIPVMLEIVEEYEDKDEPLIVFCNHREPLDLLAKRPGWRAIVGGVKTKESEEAIELFQRGALKGLACSTRAAGTGITLTRGRVMLFVDRDFTPSKNQQAEARFYRIGQEHNVLVLILVATHPLDARQSEISLRKQKFIEFGVDAAANDAAAPRDEALEAKIRAVQEELSSGKAVRRNARNDEEKEALDALHQKKFDDVVDARLALDLGEEAVMLGLSDAQWEVAVKIAERGKDREEAAA